MPALPRSPLAAVVALALVSAPGVGYTVGHYTSSPAHVEAAGPELQPQDDTAEPAPDPTVEAPALAAVRAAGGVDLAAGRSCSKERLVVSWSDPGPGWSSGAFISPLGPAPSVSTTAVNGVVRCEGSHHAFVGFDAVRTAAGWDIELVPDPAAGEQDEAPGANELDPAPVLPQKHPTKQAPVSTLLGKADGVAIEGFARYEGQSTCSPTAKPGTLALRDLLLSRYPTTTSLGIVRGCSVGGRSEHKEGRAFDWGVSIGVPADRAAAEDLFRRLFATDTHGNRYALARRMGVMYLIWDRQIWSAYRADAGWRAYSGSNPHTDHVHISLSWAGALGKTSFWSGKVVDGMPAAPVGGSSVTTVSAHKGTTSSSGGSSHTVTPAVWRRRHHETATPTHHAAPTGTHHRREQRPRVWWPTGTWDGRTATTWGSPDPDRHYSDRHHADPPRSGSRHHRDGHRHHRR